MGNEPSLLSFFEMLLERGCPRRAHPATPTCVARGKTRGFRRKRIFFVPSSRRRLGRRARVLAAGNRRRGRRDGLADIRCAHAQAPQRLKHFARRRAHASAGARASISRRDAAVPEAAFGFRRFRFRATGSAAPLRRRGGCLASSPIGSYPAAASRASRAPSATLLDDSGRVAASKSHRAVAASHAGILARESSRVSLFPFVSAALPIVLVPIVLEASSSVAPSAPGVAGIIARARSRPSALSTSARTRRPKPPSSAAERPATAAGVPGRSPPSPRGAARRSRTA